MTHELAVCFSLLASSSPGGQGASGFAANEAEMGKFCCSLSVWIPFTELPGSKSNCCTFLCIDEEGDVEIGSTSPAYVQPRLLVFISLDIMLCSRQMFAT